MKKIFLALCLALCAYAWGDEFLTGTELSGDGWRGLFQIVADVRKDRTARFFRVAVGKSQLHIFGEA